LPFTLVTGPLPILSAEAFAAAADCAALVSLVAAAVFELLAAVAELAALVSLVAALVFDVFAAVAEFAAFVALVPAFVALVAAAVFELFAAVAFVWTSDASELISTENVGSFRAKKLSTSDLKVAAVLSRNGSGVTAIR
jgi:hypothetical protein